MNRRRPSWSYRWMMFLVGPLEYWLDLSCKSFMRRASEKYERDLTPAERVRQAIHRAMCGICRLHERRLDQMRALALELARDSYEGGAARLSPEVRDRMRDALFEAAQG